MTSCPAPGPDWKSVMVSMLASSPELSVRRVYMKMSVAPSAPPPLSRSAPAPPMMTSPPAPPLMVSLPPTAVSMSSPAIWSLPEPASMLSAPPAPKMMSSPAPELTVSLPRPPSMLSAPEPVVTLSLPSPPNTVLLPSPALTTSLPEPAVMLSAPPVVVMTSLPAPESMVSLAAFHGRLSRPPLMVSLPVPVAMLSAPVPPVMLKAPVVTPPALTLSEPSKVSNWPWSFRPEASIVATPPAALAVKKLLAMFSVALLSPFSMMVIFSKPLVLPNEALPLSAASRNSSEPVLPPASVSLPSMSTTSAMMVTTLVEAAALTMSLPPVDKLILVASL